MFTGIIKHQGRFKGYRHGKQEMSLVAPDLAECLAVGESLAVNGVCLSITVKDREALCFHLSKETLARTTLGRLRPGDRLNLETPLTLSAPLSGHLVTGHIDYRGRILQVTERRPGKRMTVSLPPESRPLVVAKGSVAVDGVSLTVAAVASSSFEVELIPITLQESSLGRGRAGDEVNVECDIIGKYVYNWLSRGNR